MAYCDDNEDDLTGDDGRCEPLDGFLRKGISQMRSIESSDAKGRSEIYTRNEYSKSCTRGRSGVGLEFVPYILLGFRMNLTGEGRERRVKKTSPLGDGITRVSSFVGEREEYNFTVSRLPSAFVLVRIFVFTCGRRVAEGALSSSSSTKALRLLFVRIRQIGR